MGIIKSLLIFLLYTTSCVRLFQSASQLKIFKNAIVIGSNRVVSIDVLPAVNGQIDVTIKNLTSQQLNGEIKVDSQKQKFKLNKSPDKITLVVKKMSEPNYGKLYKWRKDINIDLSNGGNSNQKADLTYFYVPKTAKPLPLDPSATAWSKIPAITINNNFINKKRSKPFTGKEGDIAAKYQMAWDKKNLYLKVSVKDDEFHLTPWSKWINNPKRDTMLYINDACLEVYLDTGANGKSNTFQGYDDDDYRYDFFAKDAKALSGPGSVYRLKEPYHQLAGGVDMPRKKQAAKLVKCQFTRNGNEYSYVIIFPQVTIEPLALRKGFRVGFGLFIHDKDKNDRHGLSLAAKPGAHCNRRPDLWPIMVLSK